MEEFLTKNLVKHVIGGRVPWHGGADNVVLEYHFEISTSFHRIALKDGNLTF